MKIKKGWIYVLLAFTMLVLYFALRNEFKEIMGLLFNLDLKYVLLSLIVISACYFIDMLKLREFTKVQKKEVSLKKIFQNIAITRFFSAVTPFATGGQPAQIYLLTKEGFDGEEATGISIQNFIAYEIVFVFFGTLALIYGQIFHVFESVEFFNIMTIIGFLIHVGLLIFFILVTIRPNFTIRVVNWFLSLLSKIKIIKDADKKKEKAINKIVNFHDHVDGFRKNRKLNIKLIILNSISTVLYYLVPIILLYSLGIFNFNPISVMVAVILVMFIASFIPVPGASGGVEFGFAQFVGVFFISSTLAAVLLLWRLMTYYLPLFIGMIVLWLSDYNKSEKNNILVNKDIC